MRCIITVVCWHNLPGLKGAATRYFTYRYLIMSTYIIIMFPRALFMSTYNVTQVVCSHILNVDKIILHVDIYKVHVNIIMCMLTEARCKWTELCCMLTKFILHVEDRHMLPYPYLQGLHYVTMQHNYVNMQHNILNVDIIILDVNLIMLHLDYLACMGQKCAP